eukprot:scpid95819/ scgid18730/ 
MAVSAPGRILAVISTILLVTAIVTGFFMHFDQTWLHSEGPTSIVRPLNDTLDVGLWKFCINNDVCHDISGLWELKILGVSSIGFAFIASIMTFCAIFVPSFQVPAFTFSCLGGVSTIALVSTFVIERKFFTRRLLEQQIATIPKLNTSGLEYGRGFYLSLCVAVASMMTALVMMVVKCTQKQVEQAAEKPKEAKRTRALVI